MYSSTSMVPTFYYQLKLSYLFDFPSCYSELNILVEYFLPLSAHTMYCLFSADIPFIFLSVCWTTDGSNHLSSNSQTSRQFDTLVPSMLDVWSVLMLTRSPI